jgi:hypothetical protein
MTQIQLCIGEEYFIPTVLEEDYCAIIATLLSQSPSVLNVSFGVIYEKDLVLNKWCGKKTGSYDR